MRLQGKVTLITGAAAGLGAGIAERFLAAGASVALIDIDGGGASRRAAALGSPTRTIALQGDVSSEKDVERAVKMTVERFGPVDVLVNNAGVEITHPITEFTEEAWNRQLNVNLKGAFLFCKHVIPQMRRGGSIINIASIRAFVSYAGGAAYDASKSGLLGLTRAIALDHGRDGIRANSICPGYMQTPMLDQWLATLENPDQTMRDLIAHHPLGRIGSPHDVADAALFLASDFASFITGTSLLVDGGLLTAGR